MNNGSLGSAAIPTTRLDEKRMLVPGYVVTICSGIILLEHDERTGARPGRLVRGHERTRQRASWKRAG